MRLILLSLAGCFVGCSAENTVPPPFTPQHRDAIKQSLTKLGAKVTAEIPEGVYLTLRNTHVQIRELGATIESAPRTQQDIQDFATGNQAIANCFLESGEAEQFKKWLRTALARQAAPVLHAEYDQFNVTLSRDPLRAIVTRKQRAKTE
jgi:hypothetical protein